MNKALAAVLCTSLVASPAAAGTAMLPQPFQVGDETAHYANGVATVSLEQANGAVQITPLPLDHGSVSFAVVVYNDSEVSANFDTANIDAEAGGVKLAPFTVDELESAAKRRATWSAIGVALLAGAAAAAASQAYTTNTYRSRMRTPHGTYSWVSSYRDNSVGVLGAAGATAAGVAGVTSIQGRLDATLAMLSDESVQRTTVEPGASYGGRVVLAKIKAKDKPQDVRLAVEWNGETYRFGLHIPKKGEKPVAAVRTASAASRNARVIQASATAPIILPSPGSSIAPLAPNDPNALRPVAPTKPTT